MTRTAFALVSALVLLASSPASALGADLRVGLAIPTEGSFAPLGKQIREGFEVWQAETGDEFTDLVEGEDRCDAKSGVESAQSLAEAGVDIVVGYLCAESLAAALPVLSAEGIPVLTLTVRADILAEEAQRNGWLFYRLAPRDSREAEVAAEAITSLWADRPFALIEDGTIQGRELVEAIRVTLEERGLKPNFIDNYRPGQERQPSLVRRLKAAGVARVFVGGDRSDLAIIARDANAAGLDLRFMGGDALNAPRGELPIPEGTLAIIATDALADAASSSAASAFAAVGLPIEGLRLPAYVAAQVLGALAPMHENGNLGDLLERGQYGTALGIVSFDTDGERQQPGFSLAEWRDGRFERVIAGAAQN
jgi:branched-chain amino acid transport system substrate-binding protein